MKHKSHGNWLFHHHLVRAPPTGHFCCLGFAFLPAETRAWCLCKALAKKDHIFYIYKDEDSGESSSLLPGRDSRAVARKHQIVKAAFYAVQVFYSFFIM